MLFDYFKWFDILMICIAENGILLNCLIVSINYEWFYTGIVHSIKSLTLNNCKLVLSYYYDLIFEAI